jgi:hypothetical protein
MDHILANSDNPIPAADAQGAEAPAGDDEDEDEEGLKAHIKKMGGEGEDLVAKVSSHLPPCVIVANDSRSSAASAERSSNPTLLPVSTLKGRVTKSLKSRPRR